MITALRRYLESWIVRGLFLVMILAFVFWGVGDVVRLAGTSTWVAKVGGQTIEAPTLQSEYQRAMSLATRDLPAGQEATADLRRQVASETLQRLIGQAVLGAELRDLRVTTPDTVVADYVRAMPAFRGPDGKFSRTVFDVVLRNNGLSEGRFMEMLRADLAQRQLLGAVSAGAAAPDAVIGPIYASEYEKRSADMAEFPIAAAPEPATPDEAVLARWYDNHPDLYSTPEYRRVKAIVLSPQILGREISISDAELQAAFEQTRSSYVKLARRTAEVISVPDEAAARTLAETWRGGADWAAMQQAATSAGASAVVLEDATEAQFPDPDLSKAVFAAAPDTVTDPVKGAFGWYVLKVTKAVAGSDPTFEEVKDAARERVVADKAADLMYDRANRVDNLIGNGTKLNDMPGDLGLAGVSGTLDARGSTTDGLPAPIPGGPEVRSALVTAAFQTAPGEPPRLIEVQTPASGGSAYYALEVEDVIAPALRPYDEIKERVLDDWKQDQQKRLQEQAAARMLEALKGGQSFSDAAVVAGVVPRLTPLVTRAQPSEAVPLELQRAMFQMKKGEPTMVETPEAFIVATLVEIVEPDPKADQPAYELVRGALTRSIGNDLTTVFTEALRQRADPRINQKNYDQIVQP